MKRDIVVLILILVLSLSLRLAHFAEMKRNNPIANFPIVDSAEYVKDAAYIMDKNILGRPGSYWHPPLYTYMIAMLFKCVGRSVDAVKIVQILMDVLNTLMIFFISRKIFNKRVAMISMLLYAMYIPSVQYSNEILPPVLIIFLLLISTLAILKFTETTNAKKIGYHLLYSSGVSFGLLIITLSNFLFCLSFIILWLYVYLRRFPFTGRIFPLLIFTIITLVPSSLATLRNYLFARESVVISYNGGINFYIGNNADINETLSALPGFEWEKLVIKAYAEARITNFADQSRFWMRKGIEFILHRPLDWIWLMVKKSILYYNAYEFPRNFDQQFFGQFSLISKLPIFKLNVIYPLGLAAIILIMLNMKPAMISEKIGLILLLFFSYSFTIILIFVSARYRMPIIPFLIIFASYFIYRLLENVKGKEYLLVIKSIIILLAAVIFTQIKFFERSYPYRPPPSFSYVQVSQALLSNQRFDRALDYLHKGLELPRDRYTYQIYYGLGVCRLIANDQGNAVEYFRKSWELKPDYYEALNMIGIQFRKTGDYDSAIYFFEKARELAECNSSIYVNLSQCYFLKKKEQKAVDVLESFHKYCPSPNPSIDICLGNLYWKSGEKSRAAEKFEEAIQYPQGQEIPVEVYNMLGAFYLELRMYDKANEMWQKGLKVDNDYQPIINNLNKLKLYQRRFVH